MTYTYRVIEVRKYLEGKMQHTCFEVKGHTFNSRYDAYGNSLIRMYQIGRDELGIEYIVVRTKIIEEESKNVYDVNT